MVFQGGSVAKPIPAEAVDCCHCADHPTLIDGQKYCSACGGRNPKFKLAAHEREFGRGRFGQDCRNEHAELRKTMQQRVVAGDKYLYPYCEDCGSLVTIGSFRKSTAPM